MRTLIKSTRIARWALKPKRDARGQPKPGQFVPAWGGRKESKYDPVKEDQKHGLSAR